MTKYNVDTIPICVNCDAGDMLKTCKKCKVTYCKHFASPTDVQYCGNCISDFTIKETILEKQVEHVRPDGSVSFSRKYQARHMKIEGTDWLFQMALIPEMKDEEIEAAIEYHRANIGIMLQERESRKLEHIRKLSGIRIPNTKHETQEAREKREAKEAAKLASGGKRTTTKTKAPPTQDDLANMIKMLAKNMTLEQLTAALGGKK